MDSPLDYGLDGLTPGQKKWHYIEAAKFLDTVMMDPGAPGAVKQLIREQNAVGLLFLQNLLAAYRRTNE